MKNFLNDLVKPLTDLTDSNMWRKLRYFFKEWVFPVAIALIIVLFLNKFVFILVTVPTGSMEDTIIPGDRLYVNELFDVDNSKRGDILVFKSDELDNKRLVKRLIGLPGETVEIKRDGSIYVDGEKLKEPYAASSQGEDKVFVIPESFYFFLGDNRPISYDARYWNEPYISEDKVIGKVEFRFFPLNRIGEVK
ncbi:MAG: signal peptidase I [Tissierellia bacterium]|jgi:signal peptidase I|nr:signal peptidase I [Tissierellia bacterium]MDD4046317.1 signal peptidase I [Tissierellia bacterium]MDD4678806.1 signal peptidase I [Tissierellia bacterium]